MSARRARAQRLATREERILRERLTFDGATDKGAVIPASRWADRVTSRGGWHDVRVQPTKARDNYVDLVARLRARNTLRSDA